MFNMKLNELINEALGTVESQGITFNVEEIVKRQYDEYSETRYVGKNYPTHVTEWNYISENNMSIEEYQNFLKEHDISLCGYISFRKFRIRQCGKTYYRHIAYEKWFD